MGDSAHGVLHKAPWYKCEKVSTGLVHFVAAAVSGCITAVEILRAEPIKLRGPLDRNIEKHVSVMQLATAADVQKAVVTSNEVTWPVTNRWRR